MSSQVFWFAARASGIVAWALAAGSVVWGLALSTRVLGGRPRPAWLFDLHRFLGGLALVFVGVHVLAVLADSYASPTWRSPRWWPPSLHPGSWPPPDATPCRRGDRTGGPGRFKE